jgi:hypothetical protein
MPINPMVKRSLGLAAAPQTWDGIMNGTDTAVAEARKDLRETFMDTPF